MLVPVSRLPPHAHHGQAASHDGEGSSRFLIAFVESVSTKEIRRVLDSKE